MPHGAEHGMSAWHALWQWAFHDMRWMLLIGLFLLLVFIVSGFYGHRILPKRNSESLQKETGKPGRIEDG